MATALREAGFAGEAAIDSYCSGVAALIEQKSLAQWGSEQRTVLVGRDPRLVGALERVTRVAASRSPVLITGESGTGKELFARALFLSSPHHRRAFLSVNCAQYCGTGVIASELFGHRRGSFTGAVADHRGVFEAADGGHVFLDEIGDLPPAAQAMLLRVISEGEVVPVGQSHAKRVDVRIAAATNRDLRAMVAAGTFRGDLYYRLRQLEVHVPPLRQRGGDWELLLRYFLERLNASAPRAKSFSDAAVHALRVYSWPGNVREVRSIVETGFHLSDGALIGFEDFGAALESAARDEQFSRLPLCGTRELCERMAGGKLDFWEAVHRPFLERELNRAEVRSIVEEGLVAARGSYKRLLGLFGVADADYLKFMDFLRHHRLKPER